MEKLIDFSHIKHDMESLEQLLKTLLSEFLNGLLRLRQQNVFSGEREFWKLRDHLIIDCAVLCSFAGLK